MAGYGRGVNGERGYVSKTTPYAILSALQDTSAFAAQLTAAYPGRCVALRADLAVEADVVGLAEQLRAHCPGGKLHCLVNNSGTNWAAPIEE